MRPDNRAKKYRRLHGRVQCDSARAEAITVIIRINAAAFIKFLVLQVRRLFKDGVYSRAAFIANFITTSMNSLLNSRSFRELSSKAMKYSHFELNNIVIEKNIYWIGYLHCLIMNASNKRRIDEKKCGVYSRAAFNNIFACSGGVYSRAAFIRGRRLFE